MDKNDRENLIWICIIIGFVLMALVYYNQDEVCHYTTVGHERMKICTYR